MARLLTQRIKDVILAYAIFGAAFSVVYELPRSVGLLIQIIMLALYWRSRKDYVWVASVFVIESSPGNLFSKYDPMMTFSLVRTNSGVLYFYLAFLGVALMKAILRGPREPFFLKKLMTAHVVYFAILLVLFGFSKFFFVFRMAFSWALLFVLVRLFRNEDDYVGFFSVVFSFLPIVLATQLFKILNGYDLSYLFGGPLDPAIVARPVYRYGGAVRAWSGVHVAYMSLLGAMIVSTLDKKKYSEIVLVAVVILSVVVIILSATRTWFVSSLLMIVAFYVYVVRLKPGGIVLLVSTSLAAAAIISSVPWLKLQTRYAFDRFRSVEELAAGDISAAQASTRFAGMDKALIQRFEESPIVGWGFGKTGYLYVNSHLGYHSILVQTGIVGFGLFILTVLIYLRKIFRRYSETPGGNPYRRTLLVFPIFLGGTLFLNTTTWFIGYLVPFEAGAILCMQLASANFFYHKVPVYNGTRLEAQ